MKALAGLLVASVALWLAAHDVRWGELREALVMIDRGWLVVAVCISFVLQIFRAWRWQLELRPLRQIGLARLWVVVSVAYMAINVLPVRAGEIVRPWLLSRREPVTFSNVVGSVLVEKTMDSAVIVFYILLGLLTAEALPEWVRHGAVVPAVAFGVMVALVVLLWWRGEHVVQKVVACVLPDSATERVTRVARSVVDGMRVLGDPRLAAGVFAVSLALWFLPILSSYVMTRAFQLDVPFTAALVVFIFIGFGTALPQAPGMVGTYQYACVLALGLFGVPQEKALAYGIVLNAVQLGTLVVQGLVALKLAKVRLADLRGARREDCG